LPAGVPLPPQPGRRGGSRPGCSVQGVSQSWRVPRRLSAVVVDLSHHVQRRDVAAAYREVSARPVDDAATSAMTSDGEQIAPAKSEVADWSDMADEHVLRAQLRRQVIRAVLALPAIY